MSKTTVAIEIDEENLGSYSDQFLAVCWHVAQANPAAFGNAEACDLAERVGREIIRRWLASVPPELWNHQASHIYVAIGRGSEIARAE